MMPMRGFGLPEEYMDLIASGGVEAWQDTVALHVQALAPFNPSGDSVVFQLGNEITQPLISESLRAWVAAQGGSLPGQVELAIAK